MLMHFRRRRSAAPEVELTDELEPAVGFAAPRAADPEAALLGRERALRVHMALDGLPDRYARALEWKYLDRLAVEEIATRLGVGAKAAESLLARARQAFRAGYARIEIEDRR
jgi:RNA polymerase sigma factor (sigma-70 family)